MNKSATMLALLCVFAVSSYAHTLSKHFIGERVTEFAAKEGVDMEACHKLKVRTWTCKALMSAEQGHRVEIGKKGDWSAVLDGGKLVSYNDDLKK